LKNRPLLSALESIIRGNKARFHVPGHKGAGAGFAHSRYPLPLYDLTEIPGADSLYQASGPIRALEENISALYGSAGSLISCGGATLAIQAMLALTAREGEKVIMARGVHASAVGAAALIGFDPVWIYPRQDAGEGLPGRIAPDTVENALEEHPDAVAVYVTSPDYFGVLHDIPALAAVCQKHDVPLLVDNAHGAHLPFVGNGLHPIAGGAALCADSAHKTLPAFTGAAFLHIGRARYLQDAKTAMSLFGSTSPSYLIMSSIDGCMGYMEERGRRDYLRLAQWVCRFRKRLLEMGFILPQGIWDPIRISINGRALGYLGEPLADYLRLKGIEPEYVSRDWVVLVPTPFNPPRDFHRLEQALTQLPKLPPLAVPEPFPTQPPQKAMHIRQAVQSEAEVIPVGRSVGRIAAESKSPCPPGVPLVVAGEVIDRNLAEQLFRTSIFSIKVVN